MQNFILYNKNELFHKKKKLNFYKILKLILLFIILIDEYQKKSEYLNKKKEKNQYLYKEQKIYRKIFMKLKPKTNNPNDQIFLKEKKMILKMISKSIGRKIIFVNTIIFSQKCNFGNCLIYINKLIFFCEIIGCKRIILDKNIIWFIKKKINYKKYNITIEVDDINKYNHSKFIFLRGSKLYYSLFNIKPENRIDIIKKEILFNLPKIITNPNDIYIHIRSGDIFKSDIVRTYAQPPLCFYQKILKTFLFRKIYIISSNKNNPVINKLIKQDFKIIYKKNPLNIDISFLVNAYNIVGSISSLLINIIKLNNNLKIYFEYNIYKMMDKIYHLHSDLFKTSKNYRIFRLEPSSIYQSKMYHWKNNKLQRRTTYVFLFG